MFCFVHCTEELTDIIIIERTHGINWITNRNMSQIAGYVNDHPGSAELGSGHLQEYMRILGD